MRFFSVVITLLLIMDPLGNIPLFLSALKNVAPERRNRILVREIQRGLIVMERLMGMLLVMLAVQMFMNGVAKFLKL
jgi:multiple antibiotic resistance protein